MGFLNRHYEKAGVGISKSANKKTGSKLFFELLGRKFWLLIGLNMLFTLFFAPLPISLLCMSTKLLSVKASMIAVIALTLLFMVLIGPATAGMTEVLRKFTLEKHSFILSDFFSSFKKNFKYSAIIGFIDCLMVASCISGFFIYPKIAEIYGKIMYLCLALVLSAGITIIIMNFYIFPMIVATDLSLSNIIKNSFALACIAIKKNVITLFLNILIYGIFAFLCLINLTFLIVFPFLPTAIVSFINCFNCYPVIQKYVINPYYENKGEVNPEIADPSFDDVDSIFEDKGGSESPSEIKKSEKVVENRKKPKGKIIS
ncbi:MAG: DUF624 domain-containing protein [Ruminococcus sp.]|nr:DUF624 domain-containing protein [Ruminococcus sp.]